MLTKREVYERYFDLEASINQAKNDQKELLNQYIKSLPYKVGDLVEILECRQGVTAPRRVYIGQITAEVRTYGPAFDVPVIVNFNAIKANGQMSRNSAGIYHYDKEIGIKVIKPA